MIRHNKLLANIDGVPLYSHACEPWKNVLRLGTHADGKPIYSYLDCESTRRHVRRVGTHADGKPIMVVEDPCCEGDEPCEPVLSRYYYGAVPGVPFPVPQVYEKEVSCKLLAYIEGTPTTYFTGACPAFDGVTFILDYYGQDFPEPFKSAAGGSNPYYPEANVWLADMGTWTGPSIGTDFGCIVVLGNPSATNPASQTVSRLYWYIYSTASLSSYSFISTASGLPIGTGDPLFIYFNGPSFSPPSSVPSYCSNPGPGHSGFRFEVGEL
jgi:hypothetical protein